MRTLQDSAVVERNLPDINSNFYVSIVTEISPKIEKNVPVILFGQSFTLGQSKVLWWYWFTFLVKICWMFLVLQEIVFLDPDKNKKNTVNCW